MKKFTNKVLWIGAAVIAVAGVVIIIVMRTVS
jgi:hypothetical protein